MISPVARFPTSPCSDGNWPVPAFPCSPERASLFSQLAQKLKADVTHSHKAGRLPPASTDAATDRRFQHAESRPSPLVQINHLAHSQASFADREVSAGRFA